MVLIRSCNSKLGTCFSVILTRRVGILVTRLEISIRKSIKISVYFLRKRLPLIIINYVSLKMILVIN